MFFCRSLVCVVSSFFWKFFSLPRYIGSRPLEESSDTFRRMRFVAFLCSSSSVGKRWKNEGVCRLLSHIRHETETVCAHNNQWEVHDRRMFDEMARKKHRLLIHCMTDLIWSRQRRPLLSSNAKEREKVAKRTVCKGTRPLSCIECMCWSTHHQHLMVVEKDKLQCCLSPRLKILCQETDGEYRPVLSESHWSLREEHQNEHFFFF